MVCFGFSGCSEIKTPRLHPLTKVSGLISDITQSCQKLSKMPNKNPKGRKYPTRIDVNYVTDKRKMDYHLLYDRGPSYSFTRKQVDKL